MPKPIIAISSCILGQRVRYDADIKSFPDICNHLQQYFELLPICPEVEAGLTVPRPPVQLSGNPLHPHMTGRDDPSIDVTDAIRQFCQIRLTTLPTIHGYVFKSKSPSCGLHHIPVFAQGHIIDHHNRGLFAQAIISSYPDLPVTEETELTKPQQREHFIQQVLHYCKSQSAN